MVTPPLGNEPFLMCGIVHLGSPVERVLREVGHPEIEEQIDGILDKESEVIELESVILQQGRQSLHGHPKLGIQYVIDDPGRAEGNDDDLSARSCQAGDLLLREGSEGSREKELQ